MSPIRSNAPPAPHHPDPEALLAWYDRHRRDLPWRAAPGQCSDPYRVWLSEIMLQQTTVATVGPYFDRFMTRFPDISALAAAPLDDVLHAWQGLGYYARARNLHLCARQIVAAYDGRFPEDPAVLRALPGIGDYTAAAIAAIAFDRPVAAVDGNVERVVARLFAEHTPLPAAKKRLRELAASLVPERRAGDFAQAMMELGAVLCTPRAPRCVLCRSWGKSDSSKPSAWSFCPRHLHRESRRFGPHPLRETGCRGRELYASARIQPRSLSSKF